MQLKVESEHPKPQARGQDRNNGSSSIYISPPIAVSSDVNNSIPQNVVSDVAERQKPVLTIQVNQNQNNSNLQQCNNENANNLVNIVSCFRATTATTAVNQGIENLVQNISGSNLPFNVSVNKFDIANCNSQNEILIKNNENLLKIDGNVFVDCELNINGVNHQNPSNSKIQSKSIKRDDLNEICVADQIVISNSNVDYHNMTLDSITNQPNDKIGLIENENRKIIKNNSNNNAVAAASINENVINQITIVSNETATTTATDNNVESVNNRSRLENENCGSSCKVEATFREQRRRERRERRQARQRAQHGHRHHVSVHHSNRPNVVTNNNNSRGINGISGYEMLPDIINNHLPPPYTTLPHFSLRTSAPIPPPPPPPQPQLITPAPIVVDDCRFSFPIPIIRRSPSEHSGRKGCCGQFFHSPRSLGIIAMIALGGVACALGGAAWGASGLAGQPSTHLTISLLMIGIGVVLVTISGVAWRITTADGSACFGMEGTEFDHCGRQQCLRNSSMSHGLLYPEFTHRQPPPTYQASMQEYRLRLLLLDRDRQSHGRRLTAVVHQQSSASPPPSYRSNVAPHLRSHRHNTVISHPNGSSSVFNSNSHNNNNNNTALNGIASNNIGNMACGVNIQQNCSNRLSVPSPKDVVESNDSNSVIKSSSQVTQAREMTKINQKSQQQILINQNSTTDVPNLHHQSQIKVNSCESSVSNDYVNASSKLDTQAATPTKTTTTVCNEHDTGMITIVTINNNSNNLSKLINDNNTLV
ncbi:hypothetical protein ACKWTF_013377 [Chironomus riparius]